MFAMYILPCTHLHIIQYAQLNLVSLDMFMMCTAFFLICTRAKCYVFYVTLDVKIWKCHGYQKHKIESTFLLSPHIKGKDKLQNWLMPK